MDAIRTLLSQLVQLGGFLFVAWVCYYAAEKFRKAHYNIEYAKTLPGGMHYAAPNSAAEQRELQEAREEAETFVHA
jgi:hypothetical protein